MSEHEVGVRDLRDHLSHWIDEIRNGSVVIVTAHGRPVARIAPLDSEDSLRRLVREGRVRAPDMPRKPSKKLQRVKARSEVSSLVSLQRR